MIMSLNGMRRSVALGTVTGGVVCLFFLIYIEEFRKTVYVKTSDESRPGYVARDFLQSLLQPNAPVFTEEVRTLNSTGQTGTTYVQSKQRILHFNESGWIHHIDYLFPPPSHVCASSPDFIILVLSAPQEFAERRAIRETWGSVKQLYNVPSQNKTLTTALAFLLGNRYNSTLQDNVLEENSIYKDIVQADYYDSYKNITYKSVLALKFAAEFCSTSQFLVKVDTDVFLNPYNMARASPYGRKNLIMGSVWKKGKVQRGKGKWVVSKEEYAGKHYPDYANGPAFIVTMDAVIKLYDFAMRNKFFVVDDVWVTGMLRERLNISISNAFKGRAVGAMHYKLQKACQVKRYINFHQIQPTQQYEIWDFLQQSRNSSVSCPFKHMVFLEKNKE